MPAREDRGGMRGDGARRGMALVVVSGLLTSLALIGALYVSLSRLRRDTERAGLDRVRASLLARSGVEFATARLSVDSAIPRRRTRLSAALDWTCRDGLTVPLALAHNPSYARGEPYIDAAPADGLYVPAADSFGAVHDRDGDGRHTGFSGRLRGGYAPYGDLFSLKVALEEGKIFVNGGYLDAGDGNALDPANTVPDHRDPDAGYNAVLRRVLDTLGAHPDVGVANLGDLVISNRPVGGYANLEPLRQATGKDLSPWLTCRAWVDRSVIRPNVRRADLDVEFWALSDLKMRRGGAPVLEPCGRAPVNVNVAEIPVLEALLSGLEGAWMVDGGMFTGASTPYTTCSQTSVALPAALVPEVAAKIAQVRAGNEDANGNGMLDTGEDADADGFLDAPFGTWSQFRVFCDTLVVRGVVPAVAPRAFGPARLLWAAANPNAGLNKEIPDLSRYNDVDKSDLLVYSTEFSLRPMAGFFSVESLGTVREGDGAPVARASVRSDLRLYEVLRDTTQADFVAGRAVPTEYLSPMSGAGLAPALRTYGASRGLGGAAGVGLSLATYPEPLPALPAAAASYDGRIGLATTETFGGPDPVGALFVHRFTDSWAPDVGTGGLDPIPMIEPRGSRQADSLLQADLTASTWDASRPNTFAPDGLLVQPGRMAMYATEGNLHPERAVVSYWVKTGVKSYGLHVQMCVGGEQRPTDAETNYLCLARSYSPTLSIGGTHGLLIEDSRNPDDGGTERAPSRRNDMPHHSRWMLVTAGWDMTKTASALQPWHRVDAWLPPGGSFGAVNPGAYPMNLDGVFEPMSAPDRRIMLGGTAPYPGYEWFGSNEILDELCIFDLGPDAAAAKTQSDSWALARYRDGRYYKRNDGAFLSSDLAARLPGGGGAGVRVERVDWTEVLPSEPRKFSSGTNFFPILNDASLAASRVSIEILEGPDPAPVVMHDTESFPARDYRAAGRVGRPVAAGPLRYRATFRPTPTWSAAQLLNSPVLETPFLDDVTVIVRPAGYPRVAAWQQDR